MLTGTAAWPPQVSASLISKIENNESGNDLKITSLVPFDHLSQLCRALLKNTSTERLDLEGCGVGDKGCALIRDLLMGNRVIKHVDLQMNQVTDVGCRSLAEILPRNTTLHKLYLGYNDIRDDGVYALIGAMRPRGQLEVFVNGNTHVSDQALSRLDRALDQQWRSAPKPKKESAPYADSPRTMTRSRVEERSEETEGREAKRARAESAARKVPKANVSLMLQDDVLLGEPFEFKFVSSERHSTDLSPETSEHSRIHLRQKFLTQWRRLQNAISELLAQEARDLTLPMAGKSLCQTACQFLSMQKSTKSSMLAQHRLQMQERMRWEACATGGQLTEEARRKKVESRVHALLVKLRHMEEDMVRQQRAEAVSQAQALPHSFGEEQGAGCLLLVPCPFRVQICLKHLSGCLST